MTHAPGVGPPPSPIAPPWWVVIGGLAVIGLGGALVGGIGSASETTPAAASTSPTVPSAPAAAAPTPTSVPKTTSPVASPSAVDFVMPDLGGSDLQSAQDAVQELGVFYSVSHDLLGSRNQVIDSNWIVCDQSVAPGERVTGDAEGQLDFGVVKREESCP